MKHLDKLYHLTAGTLIYLVVQFYSPILAILAVYAIAAGKEYYDSKHPDKHTADGWDAFATVVGVPLGMLIIRALNILG